MVKTKSYFTINFEEYKRCDYPLSKNLKYNNFIYWYWFDIIANKII